MSKRNQNRVSAVTDEFIEDNEEVELSAPWTLEKIIFMLAGIGIAAVLAAAAFIGWAIWKLVSGS